MQRLLSLHNSLIQKVRQFPLSDSTISHLESQFRQMLDALPKQAMTIFSIAPQKLKSDLLELIFNTLFRQQLDQNSLAFLVGRQIAIAFNDIPFKFVVSIEKIAAEYKVKHRIKVNVGAQEIGDVVFSGDFNSFTSLVRRQIDPDTLFFQRKLLITGDTELGLEIKNFLDDLEF